MGTSVVIGRRSMGCSFFCQICLLLLPQANSAAGEEQQEEHMVWHQVQAGFRPGHQPAKRLQQEADWNRSQCRFHRRGFLRLRFRIGFLQCLPQVDTPNSGKRGLIPSLWKIWPGTRGTGGIGDTAFTMLMTIGMMTITPPITRGGQ